jgi:RNA pseudouridylate synthase
MTLFKQSIHHHLQYNSADRLRLLPVGRLDRDSAGLLLLTNDNAWVNVLTHPSYGHEKVSTISNTQLKRTCIYVVLIDTAVLKHHMNVYMYLVLIDTAVA